jgi:hypothetical protein
VNAKCRAISKEGAWDEAVAKSSPRSWKCPSPLNLICIVKHQAKVYRSTENIHELIRGRELLCLLLKSEKFLTVISRSKNLQRNSSCSWKSDYNV